MKLEHVAAVTCDLLKFVTWLSLITCTAIARAEEPSQYFDFPLTSTENVHNLADDQSPPRPEQHLKSSMFNLLSPSSDLEGSSGAALDTVPTQVDGFEKRVFCNGFTGCGGRFRARRRRPKNTVGKRLPDQWVIKRPFCNTHGCYNSGKRSGEVSSGDAQVDQINSPEDELMDLKMKKLFCNGYGGCQNMGKRLRLLERLADQTNQRNIETRGLSGKRFFTGDFDSDADSLADSMKRETGTSNKEKRRLRLVGLADQTNQLNTETMGLSAKRVYTGDFDSDVDSLANAINRTKRVSSKEIRRLRLVGLADQTNQLNTETRGLSAKRVYTGDFDSDADSLANAMNRTKRVSNKEKRRLRLVGLADQTNQLNTETRGLSAKRVYTGDFDSDADSLANAMNREECNTYHHSLGKLNKLS